MRLSTSDIATFAYCPYLYWRRGTAQVVPPLSTFEDTARKAILNAEAKALKNNTQVTPRSLGNAWEHIWWEIATKSDIPLAEAEKTSLLAGFKFSDYCRYDISTPVYATISTHVPYQIKVENAILAGEIDMIKVPVEDPERQIVLVDFTRKDVKSAKLANDLAVLSTIYAFGELERHVTYMCIDLSEGKEKLEITSSSFDRDDIREIERTVRYLINGIRQRINYKSGWMCGECTKCDFRS